MNYPGVIAGDPDLLAKIAAARALGKPIDGHAPGLRGQGVPLYFSRGITTEHECFTLDEALEKLDACPDLHILIREGSAAKNFEALHPLLRTHPTRVMFCSDDKHPNDLEEGHINIVVRRAVSLGYDVLDVLRAATLNPVKHYALPVGLLQPGNPADFIEVRDLENIDVLRTWINGALVAERGKCLTPPTTIGERPNVFHAREIQPASLKISANGDRVRVDVIEAEDGQLVTARVVEELSVREGVVAADPSRDLLKIAVLNRYASASPGMPAVGFIRGFGLKRGAIASSVAHDSHNIVAVGVNDHEIAQAINAVIRENGGLAVTDDGTLNTLPLPIGGILTDRDGIEIAAAYRAIETHARSLCGDKPSLASPFMTLSFMALLVIPSLKISDKGLFDSERFGFIPVVEDQLPR